MAVLNLTSKQLADDYRARPIEDHGKLRIQFFELTATAAAGDALSTIDLCDLPPGAVRVLPNLSRISASAFGAGRTLTIGHQAYDKRTPDLDNYSEALDLDAFTPAALDVSGATNSIPVSTQIKYDLYSTAGVRVTAQVVGGTIPQGATLSGFLVYVYE